MRPPFPAPPSERLSITVADIHIHTHRDGIAIYCGPGPEVAVIAPSVFGAKRAKIAAAYALVLLNQTLAQRASRGAA